MFKKILFRFGVICVIACIIIAIFYGHENAAKPIISVTMVCLWISGFLSMFISMTMQDKLPPKISRSFDDRPTRGDQIKVVCAPPIIMNSMEEFRKWEQQELNKKLP
jgi:hypothetical protein